MSIENIHPRWVRRVVIFLVGPVIMVVAPCIYGAKEAADVFGEVLHQLKEVWKKP